MKEIELNKGYIAMVDDEDYDLVSKYKWQVIEKKSNKYAKTRKWNGSGYDHFSMHRLILGAKKGESVDHADGNGLNNQRFNIRICTESQNAMNRGKNPTSGFKYKGITWCAYNNRYRAEIYKDGKRYRLGRFKTEEEAALAYNEAAKRLHGAFAKLNVIQGI